MGSAALRDKSFAMREKGRSANARSVLSEATRCWFHIRPSLCLVGAVGSPRMIMSRFSADNRGWSSRTRCSARLAGAWRLQPLFQFLPRQEPREATVEWGRSCSSRACWSKVVVDRLHVRLCDVTDREAVSRLDVLG